MQMVASVSHRRPFCPLLERLFYVSFRTAELKLAERAVPRKTTQKLHQFRPKFLPGKMDYQQYTGYQTMGYNSAYHYQYATPNHLKVGPKITKILFTIWFPKTNWFQNLHRDEKLCSRWFTRVYFLAKKYGFEKAAAVLGWSSQGANREKASI